MAVGDQSRLAGSAARYALVQRVVTSRGFEKSARMRDFLNYVCNRALQDPAADIHEQEIGCAVFDRPPGYDTSADNIVRVNASQVRKKLQVYFATEGADEPIVIAMPKGQYSPVFQERMPEEVAIPAPPAPLPGRPWLRPVEIGMACSAPILALLSIALFIASRQPRPQSHNEIEGRPNLTALWSQLIRKDMRTDIVVTDSSLGLLQDLIQRPIPLSEYVHPDQWGQAADLAARPDLHQAARLAARRHYTSFANVNLARRILAMAGDDQARIAVQFARDFGVRQMKTDNVILLGSRRANPWTELVEDQLNFRFGYDGKSRQSYFENRQPRPGEPASFRNDEITSYCRIAFLPNLDKTGSILAISGTEMEGTEVGGEFLTSERWISSLRRFVPLDRNGRFASFEVLLKASKIAGPASGYEIVAHRTPQQ
jgi:hypothetical protein